jgi:ABC-2 type transport system ATP-binding protein
MSGAFTTRPAAFEPARPPTPHLLSRKSSSMIASESLTKTYVDFTAVDDVSFTARPGRATGFLGPNGAGKSTTLRILVGLTRATSATVAGRTYVDMPNPGREVGVLLDASAQRTAAQVARSSPWAFRGPASRRCWPWSA